jgi:hypothetical protein
MISSSTLARLHALFDTGRLPIAESILALEIWRARSHDTFQRLDASGELIGLLQDLTLPLRFSAALHARQPERPHEQRFHLAGVPLELPADPELIQEARNLIEISSEALEVVVRRDV